MPQIEIHADDYAISPHSSEDILNCLRAGKLDGVSVLTNMSCFEEYAVKLKAEYDSFPKKPRLISTLPTRSTSSPVRTAPAPAARLSS